MTGIAGSSRSWAVGLVVTLLFVSTLLLQASDSWGQEMSSKAKSLLKRAERGEANAQVELGFLY